MSMRVLRLIPPGRFPTVVPDPGGWHDIVGCDPNYELQHFSLNEAWWRTVCSPHVRGAILKPLSTIERLHRRLEWASAGLDLAAAGASAADMLHAFRSGKTFRSAETYLRAAGAIGDYLAQLETAQSELKFLIEEGPFVSGLNYDDSSALLRYAQSDSLLSRLIALALAEAPDRIDFLAVPVTSPQDLLTAMIAVRMLKQTSPGPYACLIDHGYENFSLTPHLDRLRVAHTIDAIFDSIIESKDERDALLPVLLARAAGGDRPKGYLRLAAFEKGNPLTPARPRPVPYLPTFGSEPILWMRLSNHRCYWSRCTFCTQNAKYENPRAPSRSEIERTLDRIAVNLGAGYRQIVFYDEAVSPGFLRQLCQGIVDRGLSFSWACRCKLELAHTRELFDLMRRAGCYEVLFGLETISPRVQKLMDKYTEGLNRDRIAEIFRNASEAGLGLFVNLIGGFPGDTPAELEDSVEFLCMVFKSIEHATYVVNQFGLFPDTPIVADPERFGIKVLAANGDMPSIRGFTLIGPYAAATEQAAQLVPQMRRRLDEELGWTRFGEGPGAEVARTLYFETGHGSLLKSATPNPFANPLRRSVMMPTEART